MVCTEDDTSLNLTIPVVMIPKSAGVYLKDSLISGQKGKPFFLFCEYCTVFVKPIFICF